MAAVALPSSPRAASAVLTRVGFGVSQTPPFGGVSRDYERGGARHRMTVTMPAMRHSDEAAAYIAALMEAKASGSSVQMVVPQTNLHGAVSITGALVNGGSQAGRSLMLDNMTLGSGTQIPAGRWFNVTVSGRVYLYQVTVAATVTANAATVTLDTLLRATPADNAAATFNNPVIEGRLLSPDIEWAVGMDVIPPLQFVIEERA